MSPAYPPNSQGYGDYSANASSVDDLVSGAARQADDIDEIIRMAEAGIKPPKKGDATSTPVSATEPEATATPQPDVAKAEPAEKKSKKDKPTKMVYSDNEISPEEKMALMPRYAFIPEGKTEPSPIEEATLATAAVAIEA